MKRWMVRLAMLSVVVLVGLLLYAHAHRGRNQQLVAESDAVDESIKPVNPIRLAGDAVDESAASGDPFATRSRLVDVAAAPATQTESVAAESRYATRTSALAEETKIEDPAEPQPLNVPTEAAAIQPSRNPFSRSLMADEPVEAAAEEEQTDEPAHASLVAAEIAAEHDEPPVDDSQDRYGNRTSYQGELSGRDEAATPSAAPAFDQAVENEPTPAEPAETEFGTRRSANEATENLSAFAPMAAGAVADRNFGQVAPQNTLGGSGKPGDARLEGAQAPRLVIEKIAPEEIQVGKTAKFVVVVRNEGEVSAHDVQIHDEIPHGTQLAATQPKAQESAGKLMWQLGELKPGAETSVQMEVTPLAEGEIGSVASVTFSAGASAKSLVTRPRLKLEVVAPKEVLIGDQITLNISVSNPGTGVAQGVVITEKVPAGMSHPGGGELEFEVGTLAPGENRSLELVLLTTKPGEATNVLLARGEDELQAEEQTAIAVLAPALKVALSGPKRRYLQCDATYQLSVSNPGTAAAHDIELEAFLPAGMEFVDANNQGQYDPAAHRVVWSLEALPAGETGKVTVSTLAVESGEHPMRVVGKAQMNLADQVEETISVEGVAAILFELVDVRDPVAVNGNTSYEIRVVNQGSAAATGIRVAAVLPPELEVTGADGPVGHKVESGRVLFEPLNQLAPKADTTYLVHVKAKSPGDQRIKVQVLTDQVDSPITKEESTRVYSDE